MIYRNKSIKSIEVEAVIFDGTISSVSSILNPNFIWLNCIPHRNLVYLDIPSTEGAITARVGDYICDDGEIFICKPDVFEKTYEIAE